MVMCINFVRIEAYLLYACVIICLCVKASTALIALGSDKSNDVKWKREATFRKVGSRCTSNIECNFPEAECDEITRACRCNNEYPVTDGYDKCGKGVFLNGPCFFDEQCDNQVWNSQCQDGFCVCRGNGKMIQAKDGTRKCQGSIFGDPCSKDEDCMYKDGYCDPVKLTCVCRPDLTATNYVDRCGTVTRLKERCFFNEQCEFASSDTHCEHGICVCKTNRIMKETQNGTFVCVDHRRNKREVAMKKIDDSCSVDADCGFEGAICDIDNMVCKCSSDFPATDRIQKCGKPANIEEDCQFDEQCEYVDLKSMCKNNKCVCRGNAELVKQPDGAILCTGKQFGDVCKTDDECAFKNAICHPTKFNCQCHPSFTATNHIDKCGKPAKVDEDCFFHEQCQQVLFDTICTNGKCACRSERSFVKNPDGTVKCVVLEEKVAEIQSDPTMIIVLSVMCLMFIIICVVLHLFSKARWAENRTIFNTPNPRLMNVSLLRDKKLDRRGSREGSIKMPPSRQPSMLSLRAQSPTNDSKTMVCRRESKGATSNGSARSPTNPRAVPRIYSDNPDSP